MGEIPDPDEFDQESARRNRSVTRIDADRSILLKSILDSTRHSQHSFGSVRGNVHVELDFGGDIDFDAPEIQRRLDRAGALDQARDEGFAVGLFLATLMMAVDDVMYPDLESLYPNVEDEALFDGFADVDADAIVEDLDEQV